MSSDLYRHLADKLGVPHEKMEEALCFARAMTGCTTPDPEAKGLQCPHCGETLVQMNCDASTGVLFARVNQRIETRRGVAGLVGVLRQLGWHIPEKAPVNEPTP